MTSYRRAVAAAVVLGLGLFALACGNSDSTTGVDPSETRGAAVQGPSPSARTSPTPSPTPRPSPSVSPTPSPTPTPRPTPTPDPEDETEFRGVIETLGNTDLTVSGRLVHVTSSTRIRRKGDPIPFSALAVGQTVEVEGTTQANGSVLASKITLEDDDDDDGPGPGAEVKFEGHVERTSGSDLTVAARLVHTNGGTRIRRKGDDLTVAALSIGQRVKVEGTQQADGSVLAKRIDVED
jgi:uncharacterized protein DUF5666